MNTEQADKKKSIACSGLVTRASLELRRVGLCGVCGLQRDLTIRNISTAYRKVLLQPQEECSGSSRRIQASVCRSAGLQAVFAALTSLL